jgi:hypothetical protein
MIQRIKKKMLAVQNPEFYVKSFPLPLPLGMFQLHYAIV